MGIWKKQCNKVAATLTGSEKAAGYRWRSSVAFIVAVVSYSMFADSFLFSFIIPILPTILEERIHQNPLQTQRLTSLVLSMNAFVSMIIAPGVGYFADKFSKRNGLLLSTWALNILGTAVTAWSTTLVGLFAGRLVQTVAGSIIWIVGMAALGDAAGPSNLAKTLGFVTMFVSAGLLSGPAVAGALHELVGYDITWLTSFAFLIVGVVLQLLMIECSYKDRGSSKSSTSDEEEAILRREAILSETEYQATSAYDEHTALLHAHSDESEASQSSSRTTSRPPSMYDTISNDSSSIRHAPKPDHATSAPKHKNIYLIMLRRVSVVTALTADIVFAMVIASFETTIPLHTKHVFGWDSLKVGMLFLLIQIPCIIFLTPAGWLKDKIGMRWPVTVGFLIFTICLWFLGVPGKEGRLFDWANHGGVGPAIYITSLALIGVGRTLLLGFGGIEVMHSANEIEAEQPGIFGPNGGYSRCFSMSNISWKGGMLLGPLVSAALVDGVGYYWMNVFLALLCLVMGLTTCFVLQKKV